MGRALQAVGLLGMLVALAWGIHTDDLGTELLGATAGFALILIGRSMQAPRGGPR